MNTEANKVLEPTAGEAILLKIEGLPPYKDEHYSIRNPKHRIYSRFTALRSAAIDQMAGRAPYRGAVRIDFVMHAPQFEENRFLGENEMGTLFKTIKLLFTKSGTCDNNRICHGKPD